MLYIAIKNVINYTKSFYRNYLVLTYIDIRQGRHTANWLLAIVHPLNADINAFDVRTHIYMLRTHKYFHPLFCEMCKKNHQDPSSNLPINITFVPGFESSRVLFISHWIKIVCRIFCMRIT